MSRESFRRDLDRLRGDVVEMGEHVTRQLAAASRLLTAHDPDAAARIVAGDAAVNERHLAVESDCLDLLSLQQPVAGDLRFVTASFKLVTDLERIGDLAVNLAERAPPRDHPALPELNVHDIATIAAEMVETALTAYETGDPGLCHRVDAQDDELDGLCERVTDLLVRSLVSMDAPAVRDVEAVHPAVVDLLLIVRDLERIGDHAVNVAARTLYAVESSERLLH